VDPVWAVEALVVVVVMLKKIPQKKTTERSESKKCVKKVYNSHQVTEITFI
jgi:hypothetical protein